MKEYYDIIKQMKAYHSKDRRYLPRVSMDSRISYNTLYALLVRRDKDDVVLRTAIRIMDWWTNGGKDLRPEPKRKVKNERSADVI